MQGAGFAFESNCEGLDLCLCERCPAEFFFSLDFSLSAPFSLSSYRTVLSFSHCSHVPHTSSELLFTIAKLIFHFNESNKQKFLLTVLTGLGILTGDRLMYIYAFIIYTYILYIHIL